MRLQAPSPAVLDLTSRLNAQMPDMVTAHVMLIEAVESISMVFAFSGLPKLDELVD